MEEYAKRINCWLEINNAPDSAFKFEFWTVSVVNGELWFYGAYSTIERAKEVADQYSLLVINRSGLRG